MKTGFVALVALVAAIAGCLAPIAANASQLIDRNASHVSLTVNVNGQALVTYRAAGRTRHVLASGALNARPPEPGTRQERFALSYAGAAAPFSNVCRPYDGPSLHWLVTACKAPDGSYWALQSWQRSLPDLGVAPRTRAQRARDLRLSHWSGELPKLDISMDWAYRRYDHLFGSYIYAGYGVYGFHSTPTGSPLDDFGRNVYVDTLNSAYGRGWRRENSFLTHGSGGTFCYGFYPHGSRPVGRGIAYRATVIGPGVTPDAFWQGPAPGAYNAALDAQAADLQRSLFVHDNTCSPR